MRPVAAAVGDRARGGPERLQGAGDAVLHEPHVPRLALLVGLAAAAGDEDPVAVRPRRRRWPSGGRSPRFSAIPAMKRSPAITASSRPRRRGRWQVARTAARSGAPNPRVCPRLRSEAVRR